MEHAGIAHAAAVIGACGAPVVLLARRRLELFGGFALLAAAEVGLAYSGSTSGVSSTVVAGAAAVLVVAGAGGYVLARRPQLVTPLVLLAAPFRLPLDFNRHHRFFVSVASGGQLGRLLLLYLVLAAASGALLLRVARGEPARALPRAIAWPAAAFVAFTALSLLWTEDLAAGVNLLEFFLLPFAVLVAVVARSPFPAWLPRTLAVIGVALGCLFAVIGLWEAATHRLLFFSPSLQVANSYANFFRVTSLFRDPSLYGRHVVLAMTLVLVPLWLRRLRVVLAGALLAVLWAGLYFSYSQSSMATLFVVVLAVAVAAGGRRARIAVVVAAAVTLLAGAAVAVASLEHHSARRATSGRTFRIKAAARVWEHHPLVGAGIGAQPRASERLSPRYARPAHFVSHTTPLTVAAELGLVGVALYVALIAAAFRAIELIRRRDTALGLALGLSLLALLVHSLFYSGFFEDPLTWFVLAVAAAALAVPRPHPEPEEVRPARTPVLTG